VWNGLLLLEQKKSKGTKVISVSGECKFSWSFMKFLYGITISEVLDMVGAKDVKAVR
jgi:NADH:ubiquinone oxidoreductase subunit F (NADH-binding)